MEPKKEQDNNKQAKSTRQERQNVRKFNKKRRPLRKTTTNRSEDTTPHKKESLQAQNEEQKMPRRRRNTRNSQNKNTKEQQRPFKRRSRVERQDKKQLDTTHTKSRANPIQQQEAKKPFRKRASASPQEGDRQAQQQPPHIKQGENKDLSIRLNQYVANSGLCSRRDADKLIAKGLITINGKSVTEMGIKVKHGDVVKYKNKLLKREKPVYVLLNKPKDFITTTKDPQGRKTVMDLVKDACEERIYPVGRLDRNTTGLLLFTNDGNLAKKLSHPSHRVQKIYKVTLDKPITEEHLSLIRAGIELDDGFVKADGIAQLSPDGLEVGIELHVGRNRIVRRIFARLGYEVMKLDRTVYAGFTKENIGRAQWRYLSEREVIKIKFFTSRK